MEPKEKFGAVKGSSSRTIKWYLANHLHGFKIGEMCFGINYPIIWRQPLVAAKAEWDRTVCSEVVQQVTNPIALGMGSCGLQDCQKVRLHSRLLQDCYRL